jgi:hypothetical protein
VFEFVKALIAPPATVARPLWREGIDALDAVIRPPVEVVIGSEQFAVAAGLVARARGTLRRSGERTTRHVLHSLNLPAGSDITRVLGEVGRLQRQVDALAKQLQISKGGPNNGAGTHARRTVRASQA